MIHIKVQNMYAIAFASSLTIDVTELLHVGHIKFTGCVPNGGTETTKQQCFNINRAVHFWGENLLF